MLPGSMYEHEAMPHITKVVFCKWCLSKKNPFGNGSKSVSVEFFRKSAARDEDLYKWFTGINVPWLHLLTLQSYDCTSKDSKEEKNEEDYFVVSISGFWISLVYGLRLYDGQNGRRTHR